MADMQALIGKTIVKIKVIEKDEVDILFYTSDNQIFRLNFYGCSENEYYASTGVLGEVTKLSSDDLKKMEKEKWYIEAIEKELIDTYE